VSWLISKGRGGLGWGGVVWEFKHGVQGWGNLGRGSPPRGSEHFVWSVLSWEPRLKGGLCCPGAVATVFYSSSVLACPLFCVHGIDLISYRPYLASVFRLRVASLEPSLALCAVGSLCSVRVGCASPGFVRLHSCFAYIPGIVSAGSCQVRWPLLSSLGLHLFSVLLCGIVVSFPVSVWLLSQESPPCATFFLA
jgi:hypothetical protein